MAEKSSELGISLTTKTFDHAYDSLNLYTWHPSELEGIIKSLYPKYLEKGMYNKTPHFLQGKIEGINPDHIGFVQEPEVQSGIGMGMSHSARMGRLGEYLDAVARGGMPIDKSSWLKAAQYAGINPEKPYLIRS